MVVAVLGLIAALGGTGYAATSLAGRTAAVRHHSARATKPLTKAQVHALIAAYFKAHKRQLIGKNGKNGTGGINGANGVNGTNGTNGANGAPGADVVDRARSSGPVTPVADGVVTPVPLTNATWTQGATELDQPLGVLNVTIPAGCAGQSGGSATLLVYLNGSATPIGQLTVAFIIAQTIDLPVTFTPAALFEPGNPTGNTWSATFLDNNCSSTPMTVNSLKIDVVGVQ